MHLDIQKAGLEECQRNSSFHGTFIEIIHTLSDKTWFLASNTHSLVEGGEGILGYKYVKESCAALSQGEGNCTFRYPNRKCGVRIRRGKFFLKEECGWAES